MLALIVFTILYFGFIRDLRSRVKNLEQKKEVSPILSDVPQVLVAQTSIRTDAHVDVVMHQEPEETHTENFGSILAKIGVAIFVLGIGFFLNYINSIGLIGNNVKFTIGLIAGGSMIGIAEYLKIKSAKYAQIIRGGGFIVWFLTIFVGSMIYNIISLPVALGFIVAVIVLSLLISIRERSETTFIIGTLGAYLVPFISGFYVKDQDSVIQILSYICILNIGIVLVAKFQNWIRSVSIGFVFSWIVLFSFYEHIAKLGWKISWIVVTVCALTYLIVFILGDIKRSKEDEGNQVSVIFTVLNTGIYSVTAYGILYTTVLAPYLGFLVALLGVIHFGVYLYIRKIAYTPNSVSALAHMIIFVVLITAAIPIQFDGPIVTMIWFVEGVILSYLATTKEFKGKPLMYILGLSGVVAGIIHMINFGDYEKVIDNGIAVVNQYYLVWLFVIILVHAIAYIWKISAEDEGLNASFKKDVINAAIFLGILGQVCFFGLTIQEIDGYASYKIQDIQKTESKEIDTLRAYYGDVYDNNSGQSQQIYDLRTISNEKIQVVQKSSSFVYIIFFTIMTVIYLLIGLMKNNTIVRRLGITTLAITVIQLFSLAWSLGPVFRIASFVGLGIVLLIIAYIYIRHNKSTNTIPAAMLLLGVLFAGSTISASTINPTEWKYVTTFTDVYSEVTANSWYMSPIDSSVWALSEKADLGDIRVVDMKNVEIPYVIVKQGMVAKTESPIDNVVSSIKIIENSIQRYNNNTDRVLVLDTGREGQVYTGITLIKNTDSTNFRKIANVYISDMLLGASSPVWREVEQKSIVYNYTDPSGFSVGDLHITFPNMASRYIKIRFEDDMSLNTNGARFINQINIKGAYIQYEQKDITVGDKVGNYLSGNFDFSSNANDTKETKISIDSIVENTEKKSTELLLKDFKAVTSITLDIDASLTNFKRDVTVQGSFDNTSWQLVATGQVYRIDSPVYKGQDLIIPVPVMTYPYVRVIIQNKNDVSLKVSNTINVTTQKVGIVFTSEGADIQTLKFLIGNKKTITPTYEIQKTLAYFNDVIPTLVNLKSITKNPIYIEEKVYIPFGEKYKNIINVVLVLFVILLGYLGYRWTRKV